MAKLTDRSRPAASPDTMPYGTILRICLALVAASAVIFIAFPTIDTSISAVFYSPTGGFYLAKTGPVVFMRNIGIDLTIATVILLIGLAIWWRLAPTAMERWPTPTPRADWWFITLGLILGPGALVNLIFKPLWGRPRPVHIDQFGGHDHFATAWAITRQCSWNCAFVSGEAAASAFNLAFVMIAPRRWRVPALIAVIAINLIVAYARIAAGGHFLSDVITAWLMTLILLIVLHRQIYEHVWLGPFANILPSGKPKTRAR